MHLAGLWRDGRVFGRALNRQDAQEDAHVARSGRIVAVGHAARQTKRRLRLYWILCSAGLKCRLRSSRTLGNRGAQGRARHRVARITLMPLDLCIRPGYGESRCAGGFLWLGVELGGYGMQRSSLCAAAVVAVPCRHRSIRNQLAARLQQLVSQRDGRLRHAAAGPGVCRLVPNPAGVCP